MEGKKLATSSAGESEVLREHLRLFEAALHQTAGSSYQCSQNAIGILRQLSRLLEEKIQHHVRRDEAVFYPIIEQKLPQLRRVVKQLRREHEYFPLVLEDFRRELVHLKTGGKAGRLPQLGWALAAKLRCHLQQEERRLHPQVLQRFNEEDWRELWRVSVASKLA